ncbi:MULTISPECIES: hypothetical protein [unclassified Dyella]|uniref:hypothetical protein n=1 Tax=unclassified Dyella TaxID=2634549 RepID=UPI000C835A04|nr:MULTISPECIES: hypothetical protein [unclassified Dyella]MDR3444022.1 hypothetical protein [Dyella sp.]PMQ06282.1 hypothetical protein DyAD56_04725 [Dyella sp. AD56]
MRPSTRTAHHERLLGAALLWLLAGAALLLTTLVPAHTDTFGWTPAFWLAGAPLVVLLALEPSLPRQLLGLLVRPRRRPAARLIWN